MLVCVVKRVVMQGGMGCETAQALCRWTLTWPPSHPWASVGYVACASDDMVVSVYKVGQAERVYQFDGHTDFVRGLAWHPTASAGGKTQQLMTAGWDGQVILSSVDARSRFSDSRFSEELSSHLPPYLLPPHAKYTYTTRHVV